MIPKRRFWQLIIVHHEEYGLKMTELRNKKANLLHHLFHILLEYRVISFCSFSIGDVRPWMNGYLDGKGYSIRIYTNHISCKEF